VDHYDLIVIGSGPAGEKGAAQAAYFGKRVALVERAPHVGGAGINTGTVPSKTLRETALYFSGLRQRGLYGVDYSVKPDLTVQDFMYREQEVVRSLREVADRLRLQMQLLGVDVRLRETVIRYDADADGIRLDLKGGDALKTEAVLVAAGRVANVAGLALERAGVAVNERGLLTINERYQTAVPHIYAAGDVIGFPALASTSMEQARVAMVHAFDLKYKTAVAPIFPLAVYTIPEIAMVGETEESCRSKKIDYCVGRALYRTNARGQITGDLGGELKLVFRYPDKTLLGVHVIGEIAAELVHVGLMVLQVGGTIEALIKTVFK